MTTQELRKLDSKKLTEEMLKVRGDLFKARFEVKSGQSKDNHHIKLNRKQIARMKTIQTEQEKTNKEAARTQSERETK